MQLTGSLAVLVALTPAALITNLSAVVPDGLLLVNEDSFTDKDLKLAGCHPTLSRMDRWLVTGWFGSR